MLVGILALGATYVIFHAHWLTGNVKRFVCRSNCTVPICIVPICTRHTGLPGIDGISAITQVTSRTSAMGTSKWTIWHYNVGARCQKKEVPWEIGVDRHSLIRSSTAVGI